MIQNLLVACGLALSVGVSSLNSNDHNTDRMTTQSTTIYDGGVTTVTQRKYDTNEVKSISDLVVGNIYKFTVLNSSVQFDFYSTYYNFAFSEFTLIDDSNNYHLNIYSNGSSGDVIYVETDYSGFITSMQISVLQYFYFVWGDGGKITDISCISASDFFPDEIVSVTNVMPTSLLEIFDNFINERIFNHSKLSTLKTTIFGQEMSVASWLSLSVSIVLGILFLVVLIKGAIWLFKIVGNLALLR